MTAKNLRGSSFSSRDGSVGRVLRGSPPKATQRGSTPRDDADAAFLCLGSPIRRLDLEKPDVVLGPVWYFEAFEIVGFDVAPALSRFLLRIARFARFLSSSQPL